MAGKFLRGFADNMKMILQFAVIESPGQWLSLVTTADCRKCKLMVLVSTERENVHEIFSGRGIGHVR
jgi:hypothetical protein